MQQILLPPDVTADEAAAILASIASYLNEEPIVESTITLAPNRGAWQSAAAFEAQELPALRAVNHRRWGAAERTRREGRWSSGIVGL